VTSSVVVFEATTWVKSMYMTENQTKRENMETKEMFT